MAETLTQTFARYAEDAEFREWNESRPARYRFVYVHQDDNVWKFSREDWWKFVNRTIRSKGTYSLPLSKHLPNGLKKSMDSYEPNAVRNVHLLDWTLEDWKDELSAI